MGSYLKNLCTLVANNQQSEKVTMEWEKIVNHISDKGQYLTYIKNSQQLNNKTMNLIKEWVERGFPGSPVVMTLPSTAGGWA